MPPREPDGQERPLNTIEERMLRDIPPDAEIPHSFLRRMQEQISAGLNPRTARRMMEEAVMLQKTKMPPKKAPQMSPELERALYEARDKIEREAQSRVLNAIPPNQGRREQQYLDHIRKHKRDNMTVLEMLHSEVPICLDNIGHRRIQEIIHTLRISEIVSGGEQQPIQFHCAKCGMNTPSHFAYFCDGHLFCAIHVPDLSTCNACNRLQEDCKQIKAYDGRMIMVCSSCLRRRTQCQSCERQIGPEFVERGVCDRCLDAGNDTGPTREFSRGIKWVGKKDGDVIKSHRVFSCEIEGMTKNNNWPTLLYKALPKEVGITEDGSLRNNEGLRGFELQTPKLAGMKGEELVRHMTTAVKTVDAFVNSLCGMHIHLDGAGIIGPNRREYPMALLQLWRTYIVFEDVVMSFLPFSRRRNDYCRPMSEAFKVNDLDVIESLAEAERFWYKERTYAEIQNAKGHQYHASRYFGANFHSLLAHGHFEIRFHSGTLMPNKILQWANLHALIMDACAEGKMDVEFFREAQATYRINDKTELLFEKIGLAQTSRQYFRSRQNKFHEKKSEDEETKATSGRQERPRITMDTSRGGQIMSNGIVYSLVTEGNQRDWRVIGQSPTAAPIMSTTGFTFDEVTPREVGQELEQAVNELTEESEDNL